MKVAGKDDGKMAMMNIYLYIFIVKYIFSTKYIEKYFSTVD